MKFFGLWLISILFAALFSVSALSAESEKRVWIEQRIPSYTDPGSTELIKLSIYGYDSYYLENMVWSSSTGDVLEITSTTDESAIVLVKKPGHGEITADFDLYFLEDDTATESNATTSNAAAGQVLGMKHYTLSTGYVSLGTEGDFMYMDFGDTISIHRYNGNSEHVIIPASINGKPVTKINMYAISANDSIRKLTIADTVESLTFQSVSKCPNLEIITLPANLEQLSEWDFAECPSLTTVINHSSLDIELICFSDNLKGGERIDWYSRRYGGVLLEGILPAQTTMYRHLFNDSVKKHNSSGGGNSIVTDTQSYAAKVNPEEIVTTGSQFIAGVWRFDGGIWNYLDLAGKITCNQWVNDQGKWYLTDPMGAMVTGWQLVDGKWYLLAPDGSMLVNWQYVNNQWYYMNELGALLTNTTTPDGWLVNADGVWGSKGNEV